MTNLLTTSNAGNLVTLSNVAAPHEAHEAQAEPEKVEAPFSTPAWMAKIVMISNSGPTVIKSNGNEYVVMYTRTVAYGPYLWPAVGFIGFILFLIVWSNFRRRWR